MDGCQDRCKLRCYCAACTDQHHSMTRRRFLGVAVVMAFAMMLSKDMILQHPTTSCVDRAEPEEGAERGAAVRSQRRRPDGERGEGLEHRPLPAVHQVLPPMMCTSRQLSSRTARSVTSASELRSAYVLVLCPVCNAAAKHALLHEAHCDRPHFARCNVAQRFSWHVWSQHRLLSCMTLVMTCLISALRMSHGVH